MPSPAGRTASACACPSHPVARALLAEFGGGIAAPSANRFGRISPTTAQHVADDLGDAVSMILDGGPCAVGIESTIVGFTGDDPTLLRPGAIGVADLERVLGRAAAGAHGGGAPRARHARRALCAEDAGHAGRAGRAARRDRAARRARRSDRRARAHRRATRANSRTCGSTRRASAAAYAHDLYANLRALDNANADAILVEAVPPDDEWLAIRDRLERATRGEDDDRD